jgi:hypothetical protein
MNENNNEKDGRPTKTKWLETHRPFVFGVTQEGELTVEWSLPTVDGDLRLGVVIPVEEVKTLARGLQENKTIQETLSAKPPMQGAH